MSRAATREMITAARELTQRLDAARWDGGVPIVVRGAMRAPVSNGEVTLEPSWRADVYYGTRARRPAFTLIAESPAVMLRDLAALVESSTALNADEEDG